ncbi:MAG: hypothetical protein ACP5GI_03220 [Sulfolobales archaeon]
MKRFSGENKEKLIIDTAGLFTIQSFTSSQEIYTVQEAIDEVLDEESKKNLNLVIASGRLKIIQPNHESIRYVTRLIEKLGVRESLSDTDIKILALAYQFTKEGSKATIVSDDSFIHRVARALGVQSMSVKYRVSGRSKLRYYICPVCGYKSLKKFEVCPICGTRIGR